MATQRRKVWGWGYEEEAPEAEHQKKIAELLSNRFSVPAPEITAPPTLDEIELAAPRVKPPASIQSRFSTSDYERAGHTYGKAYRDERDSKREPPAPHVGDRPALAGKNRGDDAHAGRCREASLPFRVRMRCDCQQIGLHYRNRS